jgi:hypothetical protein
MDNIHLQPFQKDSASQSPQSPSGEFENYSTTEEIPCYFMEPQGSLLTSGTLGRWGMGESRKDAMKYIVL